MTIIPANEINCHFIIQNSKAVLAVTYTSKVNDKGFM